MTSDSEMETWRDAWKAPEGTSGEPRILDMRREVRRKEFRLRALHLLEFASVLVLLAFSYLVVQRYPSTEMGPVGRGDLDPDTSCGGVFLLELAFVMDRRKKVCSRVCSDL